jgi:hypothetical protein
MTEQRSGLDIRKQMMRDGTDKKKEKIGNILCKG